MFLTFKSDQIKMASKIRSYLQQNQYHIEAKNELGQTLLLMAVKAGSVNSVKVLLNEFGANISAKNNDGEDAMTIANNNNNKEMIALLKPYYKTRDAIAGSNEEAIKASKPLPLFSNIFLDKVYLGEHGEYKEETYYLKSPTFDGAFILAEYYKIKYGIRIAITDFRKKDIINHTNIDHAMITNFILNKRSVSENNYKFGIIDYQKSPKGQDLGWHAEGYVFEKSGDYEHLVSLDTNETPTEKPSKNDSLMRYAEKNITNLNLYHPDEKSILSSWGLFPVHAFSMTKEALRTESFIKKFELDIKNHKILKSGAIKFLKFPPSLLKYSQTSSSVEGVDQSKLVLRSNDEKENISLLKYRENYLKPEIVNFNKETLQPELQPNMNSKIYEKSLELVEKVNKVLDFYGVNKDNPIELEHFVSRLKQSQKISLNLKNFANPITTKEDLNKQTEAHFDFLKKTPKNPPSWSNVGVPQKNISPISLTPINNSNYNCKVSFP